MYFVFVVTPQKLYVRSGVRLFRGTAVVNSRVACRFFLCSLATEVDSHEVVPRTKYCQSEVDSGDIGPRATS